mmetsp:Transcript_2204/g.3265  ORF Transcript_2204/g.3265 Transcript_2204/m.3265 type:complete len:357 (+) Transcript_2204:111-1181(+)|eukprot:CAMPEP_0194203780 /NCGR_PEP_ID=MMETSP0156-20130528/3462_1 /TAXON_ID=33649 /ORGANISM="Thalassionema nitzschioides, Strain L26-B" /LENGTH=356 /DNA_ID=CAMNT_0038929603 /DNA_START=72 /DNA_END=1142 /DNA_ORIENTATION=-
MIHIAIYGIILLLACATIHGFAVPKSNKSISTTTKTTTSLQSSPYYDRAVDSSGYIAPDQTRRGGFGHPPNGEQYGGSYYAPRRPGFHDGGRGSPYGESRSSMQDYNYGSDPRFNRQHHQRHYGGRYGYENYMDGNERLLDGYSLNTYKPTNPYEYREDKHITMQTDGRPMEAEVALWEGPHNAPQVVQHYSMDGRRNRFKGTFTGAGTVTVRNTGGEAFPAYANVVSSEPGSIQASTTNNPGTLTPSGRPLTSSREGAVTVQGGSLKTWSIDEPVDTATIELESNGMPVTALVELWQGPDCVQQVAEIYSQDGYKRPYSMEVDLMDYERLYFGSTTIAIRNLGPMEFPIKARVMY